MGRERVEVTKIVEIKQTMIPHSTTTSSLLTSATADEIHVAQILLNITTMIRTRQSGSGLKWGSKKRRSRSDDAPSSYHKNVVEYEKPPQPPQSKAEMEAAATASPVTPLAFPPSESDDHKSKHLFKKTSKKKLREEYIDMIEDLSQRRDLLRGEIQNVTTYHNKLIAFNSQLKALKQEALNYCPRKEESSSNRRNVAMEKNQKMSKEIQSHPQPHVEDQIFERSYIWAQLYWPNTNGLNHVGIPDLNVSAEEVDQYEPLDRDDRRARSAEARRRRRDIIRVKSSSMRLRNHPPPVFKFPRLR